MLIALLGIMYFFPFSQFFKSVQSNNGNFINGFASTPLPCGLNHDSARPLYLYILIDESETANVIDLQGEIRNAIALQILNFETAYGWTANQSPFVWVYQYSRYFSSDGEVNLVWPEDHFLHSVTIADRGANSDSISKVTDSLTKKLVHQRDKALWPEDLDTTLNYIKNQINQNGNQENSLVIIVTQGSNRQKGASLNDLAKMLQDASSQWQPGGTPIGVILFEQYDPAFPTYVDELRQVWTNDFIQELNEHSNIYLMDLDVDSPVNIRETKIWNWMSEIKSGLVPLGVSALVGRFEPGEKEHDLPFIGCTFSNLSIVAMWSSDENFTLNGPSGMPRQPDGSTSNLVWWNVPDVLTGNWSLQSNQTTSDNGTVFFYRYDASSLATSITITQTIPSIVPPTPTLMGTNKGVFIYKSPLSLYWVVIVLLIVIFVINIIILVRYHGEIDRPGLVVFWLSRFCLFSAAFLAIPLIRSLISKVGWDVFQGWAIIINLLLPFVTVGVYSRFKNNFDDAIDLFSPTIIVFFILEVIVLIFRI
jgi:hypothetical protein